MTEISSNEHIEGTIEALLFVSEKPVSLEEFAEVLETVSPADIQEAVRQLQKEYAQKKRGMVIVEIAGGFQLLSSPHYALAIRRFYKTTHKEKLSKPALETLAIIAYKQPVARVDVELIRGVNSDGVVAHLLLKGLIKIAGRKEVPGRPFIYGTTQQFLEYFGLKSLNDLPKLEEFPSLQAEIPSEIQSASQSKDGLLPNVDLRQNDREIKKDTSENKIRKEVETFLQQAEELNSPEGFVPFQRNGAPNPQPEESPIEVLSQDTNK